MGCAFCPDHLGAACGHHDVVDGVGVPVDMEGDVCRVIRVYFRAVGQGDAGDDIRIHPVGIVRCLQFIFCFVPIAYDADAQGGEDVGIRYLPVGCTAPGRVAQVRGFQEDGQWQVLVCQAGHFAAERAAGHLVIKCGFRGGHGIVQAAVDKVSDRFYDQLVGAGDQFLKRYARFVGHKLCGILGTEIAPDCLDVCVGDAAGDDAGEGNARLGVAVASAGGQGSAHAVLELAYLAEVQYIVGDIPIAQVKGGGNHVAVFRDDGDAHTFLPWPDIGGAAVPHAAAPAVDVPIPGCKGDRACSEEEGCG